MHESLKTYTTRAKELEAAIYTQEKLIEEYQQVSSAKRPMPPEKTTIIEPGKPQKPVVPICCAKLSKGAFVFFLLLLILGVFLLVKANSRESKNLFFELDNIVALVLTAVGGIGLWSTISEYRCNLKNYYQQYSFYLDQEKDYPKLLEEYDLKMEQYENELAESKLEYEAKHDQYEKSLLLYTKKQKEINMQLHNDYEALKRTLANHYDQGIIFPKYRNFVAITAINEYLVSGRCDSLEGANGAYNLYEMELRQNIVIGQLSSIVSNLDQIRNNQFLLFQELQKANHTVNRIIHELESMQSQTELLAYFAGVTALVEIAR